MIIMIICVTEIKIFKIQPAVERTQVIFFSLGFRKEISVSELYLYIEIGLKV